VNLKKCRRSILGSSHKDSVTIYNRGKNKVCLRKELESKQLYEEFNIGRRIVLRISHEDTIEVI